MPEKLKVARERGGSSPEMLLHPIVVRVLFSSVFQHGHPYVDPFVTLAPAPF